MLLSGRKILRHEITQSCRQLNWKKVLFFWLATKTFFTLDKSRPARRLSLNFLFNVSDLIFTIS